MDSEFSRHVVVNGLSQAKLPVTLEEESKLITANAKARVPMQLICLHHVASSLNCINFLAGTWRGACDSAPTAENSEKLEWNIPNRCHCYFHFLDGETNNTSIHI